MLPIDIHTHSTDNADNAIKIINGDPSITPDNCFYSVGLHPWNITETWQQKLYSLRKAAADKRVVAIGECGIDKMKSPANIELQKEIFAEHVIISEELEKPLIIHCVKGQEEITTLHKKMQPRQAWIIHGFRGNANQAMQMLHEGLYLSFGEKFNTDALIATPIEHILVESDTSHENLENIYAKISHCKGISIDKLCETIADNARKCRFEIFTKF